VCLVGIVASCYLHFMQPVSRSDVGLSTIASGALDKLENIEIPFGIVWHGSREPVTSRFDQFAIRSGNTIVHLRKDVNARSH